MQLCRAGLGESVFTVYTPREARVAWIKRSLGVHETVAANDVVFGEKRIKVARDQPTAGCGKIRGSDGRVLWSPRRPDWQRVEVDVDK